MIGGAVSVRDGVTLGERVMVAGSSLVHEDLAAGAVVGGWPAMPIKEFFRYLGMRPRLVELPRRVAALEKSFLKND
jgi:UDP-3-O-[3-hydroxymyristoyl] glucosamine N-acyltransferase